MKKTRQSGITLVALVVTIVVLLILAGVSISLLLGQNGLIANAKEAREKTKNATDEESQLINGTIPDYIAEQVSGSVTISGTKITSANLGQYLGKKVQYTPATPSTSYGTSTTYRLFYVDFANDFGDGAGTIYLKADNDGKTKSLTSSHTSSDNLAIMKKLNPDWSNNSGTLDGSNDNAVAWLTDPAVWDGWKDANLANKTNYVVGSPSLEMYVKSYNAYLNANPTVKAVNGNTASKLECKFSGTGYKIEIVGDNYATNIGNYLANNTLIPSAEAHGMYNPGSGKYHWLVSPSAGDSASVVYVYGTSAYVGYSGYNNDYAVCPLVSLKSDVTLTFVTE